MARIARKNYKSNYFHIMVQGINKEYIFGKSEFKERYVKYLRKGMLDKDIKMIAYCVMDNHVHILLFTNDSNNISKLMASANTRYAKFYNKTMGRCGYVYRDRYKSEMIMDYNHLLNCIRYIHNNPVNANICVSASEYKYSSYNDYLRDNISKEITDMIFGKEIDYKTILCKDSDDFDFMDIEEDNTKNILEKYEDANRILKNYKDIRLMEREEIKELILILKNRCNMLNREVSELLGLKKTTFYKILK